MVFKKSLYFHCKFNSLLNYLLNQAITNEINNVLDTFSWEWIIVLIAQTFTKL